MARAAVDLHHEQPQVHANLVGGQSYSVLAQHELCHLLA